MTHARRKPRYTVHDGFLMPMGFPVEGFDSGQRYRAAPGDVFVAYLPEVRHDLGAIHRLSARCTAASRCRPGSGSTTCSRISRKSARTVVRALPKPRLIKTHLPFERTPWHARRALRLRRAQPVRLRRFVLSPYARLREALRLRRRHVRRLLRVLRARRGRLRRLLRQSAVVVAARRRTERAVADLRAHARGPARRGDARSREFLGGAAAAAVAASRGSLERIVDASSFDQMRMRPGPLVERAARRHARIRAQGRRRRLAEPFFGRAGAAARGEAASAPAAPASSIFGPISRPTR